LMLREGQVVMFGPRDEVLAALQKAQAESQGLPSPAQPQAQAQAPMARPAPSAPSPMAGKPEAPPNVSLNTSAKTATYTTAPVPSLSTLTQANVAGKKPTSGGQS
jgi:hypothetical protein